MVERYLHNECVNEIQAIKVIDKHFDYVAMKRDANIWETTLCPDRICVSLKLKGSGRKQFKEEVPVGEEEMTEFFRRIYDFIRTSDYSDIPLDDTTHKTTIIYNAFHKETITNNLYKKGESLLGIINDFVESIGVTTFEKYMHDHG